MLNIAPLNGSEGNLLARHKEFIFVRVEGSAALWDGLSHQACIPQKCTQVVEVFELRWDLLLIDLSRLFVKLETIHDLDQVNTCVIDDFIAK